MDKRKTYIGFGFEGRFSSTKLWNIESRFTIEDGVEYKHIYIIVELYQESY